MSEAVTAYHIEAPTTADAAALSGMAQASFTDTFAHMHYPADDLAHWLESGMGVAAYATQIADPAYALRIARTPSGTIIGFIKMGPNELPMPAGEPPVDKTRELHQIYLLPEAKGTGLADALMAWGEEDARSHGARAIYLSVYCENFRAQRFYARHGYAEIGKNPFRIGNTVDDDRVWKRPL